MFETLQTLRPIDFENNITKFHQAFSRQRRLLLSSQDGHGLLNERTAIHYLLQAYRTVTCTEFTQFVNLKRDNGIRNLTTFMDDMESKYNELVRDDIWGKPSDREVIVALQADLQREKKKLAERRKKRTAKKRKQGGTTKQKKQVKHEMEGSWIHTPPKPGKANEIITRDGKEWSWCKHHAKWVVRNTRFGLHTSDTCRLNPKNQKKEKPEDKDKDKDKTKTKRNVQVNRADLRIQDDDSESSSSTEDDSSVETESSHTN
jgi:hypothetical protein